MLPPPPQGDPFQLVPPGTGNLEAQGCVLAWEAFRLTASQVLTDFITTMNTLATVPM